MDREVELADFVRTQNLVKALVVEPRVLLSRDRVDPLENRCALTKGCVEDRDLLRAWYTLLKQLGEVNTDLHTRVTRVLYGREVRGTEVRVTRQNLAAARCDRAPVNRLEVNLETGEVRGRVEVVAGA